MDGLLTAGFCFMGSFSEGNKCRLVMFVFAFTACHCIYFLQTDAARHSCKKYKSMSLSCNAQKSDTGCFNRFPSAEQRQVCERAHVCFDMTARAYSTNYFQSLISDSSGTEPQRGHLALMLRALCE